MLGLAHMCVIQTVHFWGGFQFSPILVFGFWWCCTKPGLGSPMIACHHARLITFIST